MPDFESPRLFTAQADELPLSGQALLDLMTSVLLKGVSLRFKAKGQSMTPFIRDGDVITVAPFGKRRPGLGEVVAFTHPETGKLVVHRIVARQGEHVLVVGDGVPDHPDGNIPIHDLLGRVTHVERNQESFWLGLGPERFLIAWLSRANFLLPLRAKIALLRGRTPKKDN